ncbi:hypothetical protein [Agromyces lapidis]|uniref:Uncharacterized protein n=1 Tax=Agromyces lapidis TaxID=279574 RepID=A0ABV5SQZ5_9MICO|nr:hypothetical protein [Agromyces lapidis]
MSDENTITTTEALEDVAIGQWVQDAEGEAWCLVNTHVMHPQIMWMRAKGRSFQAVDQIALPVHLADFEGGCEHRWGTNECGHCRRCGQVSAPEDDHSAKVWGTIGIRIEGGHAL